MIFHILTIFPNIFDSYFNESIIKRAREKNLIDIKTYNLRDFTEDKHRKVDDSPYGGGPGMVLKIEPIAKAVENIKNKSQIANRKSKIKVILFSTRGKKLNTKIAQRLALCDELILICGRYEGVDERVAKYVVDEEISIGDFILSGGELPAMILVDAVARFVPGVLGKKESLETIKGSYPVYTRPEIFYVKGKPGSESSAAKGSKTGRTSTSWSVPKVLISGNHQKIEEWRGQKL